MRTERLFNGTEHGQYVFKDRKKAKKQNKLTKNFRKTNRKAGDVTKQDLCEFKVSLVYIASSKPARTNK